MNDPRTTIPPFPGSLFRLESKLEQDLWCRIVIQVSSNSNKAISTKNAAMWADALVEEFRSRTFKAPQGGRTAPTLSRRSEFIDALNHLPSASIPMPPPKKDTSS